MLVRYADDAVVMCASGEQAEAALERLKGLLAELGLAPKAAHAFDQIGSYARMRIGGFRAKKHRRTRKFGWAVVALTASLCRMCGRPATVRLFPIWLRPCRGRTRCPTLSTPCDKAGALQRTSQPACTEAGSEATVTAAWERWRRWDTSWPCPPGNGRSASCLSGSPRPCFGRDLVSLASVQHPRAALVTSGNPQGSDESRGSDHTAA